MQLGLSWNEIKSRALAFSRHWADAGNEDAQAKPFLIAFFEIFGITASCRTIGSAPSALSRWIAFKEQTVIKVLNIRILGALRLELDFSDHTQGVFDAAAYLATRSGPLLDRLHDPAYFSRVFVDAGALCWPNGLEISPARVRELTTIHTVA